MILAFENGNCIISAFINTFRQEEVITIRSRLKRLVSVTTGFDTYASFFALLIDIQHGDLVGSMQVLCFIRLYYSTELGGVCIRHVRIRIKLIHIQFRIPPPMVITGQFPFLLGSTCTSGISQIFASNVASNETVTDGSIERPNCLHSPVFYLYCLLYGQYIIL